MKITLITACYNSEATIRTAIDSVLSQKGVDVEYIVVDAEATVVKKNAKDAKI